MAVRSLAPLTEVAAMPRLVRIGRLARVGRHMALFFGAVMWGAWLVSVVAGPGLLDLAGNVKGADFIEFYTAGRIVGGGDAERLYDFALQERVEHEITAPQTWSGLHSFIYPPFLALALVPFAALPYGAAYAAWLLVLLAALIATLWLVSRAEPQWRGCWIRALPWIAAFVPVFATFSYGQNALLSVFILAAAYLLLCRGRELSAGVVLGALLYKPQLLMVPLALFLLERRWGVLVGVCLAGVTLAALSFAVVPDAAFAWVDLARRLPAITADRDPFWKVHSWYGFFTLLLPGQHGLAATLTAVAALATFVAVRRVQSPYAVETLPRWFAAALWATVLINPHLMVYDLSLLVLAALLLWHRQRNAELWLGGVAVIWAAIALSQPLSLTLGRTVGVGLQFSVPVIALVGFRLLRDERAI